MNAKLLKLVGVAAVVVVLGLGWIIGLHAQTAQNKPGAPALTTNWIGCVVVGQEDRMDPIARGPTPKTVPQVQIGLRSDGVVVWRSVPSK